MCYSIFHVVTKNNLPRTNNIGILLLFFYFSERSNTKSPWLVVDELDALSESTVEDGEYDNNLFDNNLFYSYVMEIKNRVSHYTPTL